MRTAPDGAQAIAWTDMENKPIRSVVRGEWGASVATHHSPRTTHTCSIGPMSYETLLFEARDGIAVITINRPDKLNALNDQVMDELSAVADRLARESDLRGAILTGAGKAFAAGADIADLAEQGPFDGKARALAGQATLRRFETCGKPVIPVRRSICRRCSTR